MAHLAEVDPEKLPKKKRESSKKAQLNPDAKVSPRSHRFVSETFVHRSPHPPPKTPSTPQKSAFYHDLAGYDKVEADDEEDDSDDDDDDSDDDGSDDDDAKVKGSNGNLGSIEEEDEEEGDDSSDEDSDSGPPPPKKKHK